MEGLGVVSGVWFIFLVVISIVWLVLPFAIFGIKPRLDENNKLLSDVLIQLRNANQNSIRNRQTIENVIDKLKIKGG